MIGMSGGKDKITEEDFALLTQVKARQIIKKFIINRKLIEQIVDCIEDKVISGHVLKDIMKANYNMDSIKKAIKDKHD